VFGVEVLDELRGIIREPTALLFSIAMPVGFFVLFVTMWGTESQPGLGELPAGTTMLATFGTFGVLSVSMMNPGIGVAEDRERGWLRVKRVSAVPLGMTLAAKVTAALPYAVGVLVAMAAAAAVTGTLQAPAGTLLRLFALLVAGSLPFALLGLAVGFRAGANTAAAALNALLLPSAVVSGLWLPVEQLPDGLARVAPYLPTYHLAQLALAQLDGSGAGDHLLWLAGTTVVTSLLAGLSYRSARL
jgi:ABC-2 type transport system permease protein